MTGGAPMPADTSLGAVLAHHAERAPDRVLARHGDATCTYGEMAARSAALAAGLRSRDVQPGDVVALLAYNCIELLETIFAANHLGAIAMPINWRLAAPEVRYILEHSEARVLVCDDELASLGDAAVAGMVSAPVRVCIGAVAPDGWIGLDALRDPEGAAAEGREHW